MGRGKSRQSVELIRAAREILEAIQPASVRAVCYQLFNQKLIAESEQLMKEHFELLAKKNATAFDVQHVEEQAEFLKRMIEDLLTSAREPRYVVAAHQPGE